MINIVKSSLLSGFCIFNMASYNNCTIMHPQDIVQLLYEAILKIQNPDKRDDLTILIIKRAFND
jgi:serine phosphatase RsbU (regulator of sigma subunit)